MTNQLKSITIEADSLEEAREKSKEHMGKDSLLLDEEILAYGGTSSNTVYAKSVSLAFSKAEGELPPDAEIIEKKEIKTPEKKSISIKAFDEQTAKNLAEKEKNYRDEIESIKLTEKGSKGFLGIGKKPDNYEAIIFKPAEVEIVYKTKAEIVIKIGEDIRNDADRSKLDNAVTNDRPIEVICENCGRVCKALPKPTSKGTVMIMTPEIAIIAARYCDACSIVVCGACVGVSSYSRGMSSGGRPCPKCNEETGYAAAIHLRTTNTKLA